MRTTRTPEEVIREDTGRRAAVINTIRGTAEVKNQRDRKGSTKDRTEVPTTVKMEEIDACKRKHSTSQRAFTRRASAISTQLEDEKLLDELKLATELEAFDDDFDLLWDSSFDLVEILEEDGGDHNSVIADIETKREDCRETYCETRMRVKKTMYQRFVKDQFSDQFSVLKDELQSVLDKAATHPDQKKLAEASTVLDDRVKELEDFVRVKTPYILEREAEVLPSGK